MGTAGPVRGSRIIATAVTTIITPKPASNQPPGMNAESLPPPYAPAIAVAPNSRAVRHRMRPARACGMAPNALVTPTTNSDMAMACLGSRPAR